jgi:hypothetical protein
VKDQLDEVPQPPPAPEPDLPPAGDERREVLKRRMDSLQEELETIAKELEVEGINPKTFQPDREAMQTMGMDGELEISHANANYQYVWVWRDPYNRLAGRVVFAYKREGWEVVSGDMPEARDRMAVTGERWAVDCLLMRMPKGRYEQIKAQERRRRLARETGVEQGLLEQAERHGAKVFDLTTMPAYATMDRSAVRGQMARKMALDRLGAHIRAGTIPGMPMGRR